MARHFATMTQELGWLETFMRISKAFPEKSEDHFHEQHVLEWLRAQTFKEPQPGSFCEDFEQLG